MTIDELLAKHPAPWTVPVDIELQRMRCAAIDSTGQLFYINGDAFASMVNAYAALKAEADNLRACVAAADEMRGSMIDMGDHYYAPMKPTDNYDTVRAKVKP